MSIEMRKSDTKTIIGAMRILSREIYCEDGVATAAIAEAADRLEEISLENDVILRNQLKLHEENEKLKKDLFDSDMSRSILLRDVAFWRDYADKLVAHKDMVCLPKDLQNLRTANSQFATENHILKEQLRMMETSKNKTTWT
jgi:hypothetical protein